MLDDGPRPRPPHAADRDELPDGVSHRPLVGRGTAPYATVDGRPALLLCGDDYLGLAWHPSVRTAAAEAALRWGAGAGATPIVAGQSELHRRLEDELAEFVGLPEAVLFGSGFLAAGGVLPALGGDGHVLLCDAWNHAGLVHGSRIAAGVVRTYRHGDLDDLERLLAATGTPTCIVTESLFALNGDIAPLAEIATLARAYDARLVVDESHALGVTGRGRGLVAELGLTGQVDVIIGSLGTALGSYGAFAAGRGDRTSRIVVTAATLALSSGLPPAAVGAALAALRVVRCEPTLVGRAEAAGAGLRRGLGAAGLAVGQSSSPVLALEPPAGVPARAVVHAALDHGVHLQAIRPPSGAGAAGWVRMTVGVHHTDDVLRGPIRDIAISFREARRHTSLTD